jgi:hypothetical protein
MCYSANTSIATFLSNYGITFVAFLFALNSDTKVAIQFLSFIGLMQLFDYMFWINPSPTKMNYIITKIAMIVNLLQPIIMVLLIYNYKNYVKDLTLLIVALYTVFAIIYINNSWSKVMYTKENVKGEGLVWEWHNQKGSVFLFYLFILSLAIASYENLDTSMRYILSILLVFTYLISWLKNNFRMTSISTYSGRLWCYYSALLPGIILLLNHIF